MSVSREQYSDLPEAYNNPDELSEPYASPNEALEVVRGSEGKEVARSREDDAPELLGDSDDAAGPSAGPKRSGLRRKRTWIIITAGILILAIALGIGLGVGLSQSDNDNRRGNESKEGPNRTESYISPYLSTKGAFNGTDIAVTGLAKFASDGKLEQVNDNSNYVLIYQHYNGELRWMQYVAPDTWYGGNKEQILASDAKNATPIDTTVDVTSGLNLHVYYVDKNNVAKEKLISSTGGGWSDGDLNKLNYTVLDGLGATLRIGRYTGPMADANLTVGDARLCAKIFISRSETEFDELGQCPGTVWTSQKTWSGLNARAPPAYRGWTESDSTLYVAFVGTDGNVQVYWIDTTLDHENTPTHPLNFWTPASLISIHNVEPTAGLSDISGAGTLVGRASNNGSITNWNVTLSAENSTVSPASWTFEPPQIVSGSLLKVITHIRDQQQLLIWYQAFGDDITMASGTITSGPMGDVVAWPIPDD